MSFLGRKEIDGNISIVNMKDVTEIHWDPFICPVCAINATTVVYDVTITTPSGEPEGRVVLTGETSAIIFNTLPNQEYKVSIDVHVSLLDSMPRSCIITKYLELTLQTSRQDQSGKYNCTVNTTHLAGHALYDIISLPILNRNTRQDVCILGKY